MTHAFISSSSTPELRRDTTLDRNFQARFDEFLGSLSIPLAESNPTPRTEIDGKIGHNCDRDRSDERRTVDIHRTGLKVKPRLFIESTVYDHRDPSLTR